MSSWESQFRTWAGPPSRTEEERCENAIRAIKNAVNNSSKLKRRKIKTFTQGSYRNRVNVRHDSDVDVGVMCSDVFLSRYPEGKTKADFGNKDGGYPFKQFKDELEEALVDYFGRKAVTRGNKAIDIKENSYHVEADVAPLFEFRQYFKKGSYRAGVALVPDNGGRIENYPERLLEEWPATPLHYENGLSKNDNTRRAYRGMVRIIKQLRNRLDDAGKPEAKPVPGFLLECMTWNVPNVNFTTGTWDQRFQAVLSYLWSNTKDDQCKEWTEVNGIKYLFHPTQKWTRQQAHDFINVLWDYVGVRK